MPAMIIVDAKGTNFTYKYPKIPVIFSLARNHISDSPDLVFWVGRQDGALKKCTIAFPDSNPFDTLNPVFDPAPGSFKLAGGRLKDDLPDGTEYKYTVTFDGGPSDDPAIIIRRGSRLTEEDDEKSELLSAVFASVASTLAGLLPGSAAE
jgi:hypothetical protein